MGRGLKGLGFDGVSAFRDRHGKVRYRFRRKGSKSIYLVGLPGSPEFAASYADALNGIPSRLEIGAGRTLPGTIHALAVMGYASAEWSALAETTQSNYRGVMERLRRGHGNLPVRGLTAEHIFKLRDRITGQAARNNFIKALRWFLVLAVSRGWRKDNPALAVKKIKYQTEGYHTWSEAEVEAFEKHWPVGTKQRLGMDLLLYTGQRSKDVRMMGRQHLTRDGIRVRQAKTGTELTIAMHPRLATTLAAVPADQMLFLPTQYGPPYTATGFYNWMKAACRKAGVPDCSPHGLRKCIATRLADAGCSHSEIMAVTGHKNPKEVETYIRARDQRRLSAAAMAKIGTDDERDLANQSNQLANPAPKPLKG